jgi:hypothetical protein
MRTQNMVKFKEQHSLGAAISQQDQQGTAISINEHRIQASTMIGSTSVSLSVPLKTVFLGVKHLFS